MKLAFIDQEIKTHMKYCLLSRVTSTSMAFLKSSQGPLLIHEQTPDIWIARDVHL